MRILALLRKCCNGGGPVQFPCLFLDTCGTVMFAGPTLRIPLRFSWNFNHCRRIPEGTEDHSYLSSPGRDCIPVVFGFGYLCISVNLNNVYEKSKKNRITVHCALPRAPLIVPADPGGRLSPPGMWGRMLTIVSFPSGVPTNFCSIALPSGDERYFLTAHIFTHTTTPSIDPDR